MVTLGLGTAQFGLDYGTFNKKEKFLLMILLES